MSQRQKDQVWHSLLKYGWIYPSSPIRRAFSLMASKELKYAKLWRNVWTCPAAAVLYFDKQSSAHPW